jgi:hypothetical protein
MQRTTVLFTDIVSQLHRKDAGQDNASLPVSVSHACDTGKSDCSNWLFLLPSVRRQVVPNR